MFAQCRLADVQFSGNEQPADPILHKVAGQLGREMAPWRLQPGEDLQASRIAKGTKYQFSFHIDN